jgi:spore germination protein YaaH
MKLLRGLATSSLLAFGVAALAPAGAQAVPVCPSKAPRALHFKRSAGKPPRGRLTWRAPVSKPRGGRYRIYRNEKVIGQTIGHSASVSVKPGRVYVFAVRVVSRSGSVSACAGQMTQRVRFRMPTTPRRVAARSVSTKGVTLEWLRSRPGDSPIVGYRVLRDGTTFRQLRRQRVRVPLAPAHTYSFNVAAADSRGNVSHLSRTLRVRSHHHVPGRPGPLAINGVTESAVALGWKRARRGSARVAGYRVYRDGVPVRQLSGSATVVGNLAALTTYRFTVAAVDTRGYLGPQTAVAQVTTAPPTPTDGRAHAFLLATTGQSFVDLQQHYRKIGYLYPTYFACRSGDGAIIGADDPLVTHWAKVRHIKVLARLDCQRSDTINRILNDPATRAATLDGLANLVSQYGYDGINIDFEAGYATDRDALSTFVRMLGARLHPMGAQITVDVSPKFSPTTSGRSGFYDYPALAAAADHVFVMNWGWHWSTSAPGAVDEIGPASKTADYVATMAQKQKYVLGTNFYGADWPSAGSSVPATPLEYADVLGLIARVGATPAYDAASDSWRFDYTEAGVAHQVWFPDATTTARRIQLAADRGLGIGFWRLGTEDQRVWDDSRLASLGWPG